MTEDLDWKGERHSYSWVEEVLMNGGLGTAFMIWLCSGVSS